MRDVAKRYNMVNIMNHKWVNEIDDEDKASMLITDSPESDFSEEVLTMMLARGIDREKTIQVHLFDRSFLLIFIKRVNTICSESVKRVANPHLESLCKPVISAALISLILTTPISESCPWIQAGLTLQHIPIFQYVFYNMLTVRSQKPGTL